MSYSSYSITELKYNASELRNDVWVLKSFRSAPYKTKSNLKNALKDIINNYYLIYINHYDENYADLLATEIIKHNYENIIIEPEDVNYIVMDRYKFKISAKAEEGVWIQHELPNDLQYNNGIRLKDLFRVKDYNDCIALTAQNNRMALDGFIYEDEMPKTKKRKRN